MRTFIPLFLILAACGGSECNEPVGSTATELEACYGTPASRKRSTLQGSLSVWRWREGSGICRAVINAGMVEAVTYQSGCLPR